MLKGSVLHMWCDTMKNDTLTTKQYPLLFFVHYVSNMILDRFCFVGISFWCSDYLSTVYLHICQYLRMSLIFWLSAGKLSTYVSGVFYYLSTVYLHMSVVFLLCFDYIYIYMEKYETPLGWVRFEPTPAVTAAPSPSESGDITIAPLRLLKNKFHRTVLSLISLKDPSDRVYFWCASALIIY